MKYFLFIIILFLLTGSFFFLLFFRRLSQDTSPTETVEMQVQESLFPSPTPNPFFEKWNRVADGVELQHFPYTFQDTQYYMQVLKIDPKKFDTSLAYDQKSQFISEWQSDSTIVMNAGFFKEQNAPVGLLYIHGVRQDEHRIIPKGTGLLSIQDGTIAIRDLTSDPLKDEEVFQDALQSFPLLIHDSKVAVGNNSQDQDRRTAVGIDSTGNLYLITSQYPYLTLFEFATQLQKTGLSLTKVLNLDGGGSTGVAVKIGEFDQLIDSQTPVPTVLRFTKK